MVRIFPQFPSPSVVTPPVIYTNANFVAKDTPDREKKIEEHKQDSLSKAKTKDAEWKPELASNSEQGLKSDKHNMSMEEMQKMGEKKGEK